MWGGIAGRVGMVNGQFLLSYYYVHRFLKLVITLNLKNVMPTPPLSISNLRSREPLPS